jgi:hypothetical protein
MSGSLISMGRKHRRVRPHTLGRATKIRLPNGTSPGCPRSRGYVCMYICMYIRISACMCVYIYIPASKWNFAWMPRSRGQKFCKSTHTHTTHTHTHTHTYQMELRLDTPAVEGRNSAKLYFIYWVHGHLLHIVNLFYFCQLPSSSLKCCASFSPPLPPLLPPPLPPPSPPSPPTTSNRNYWGYSHTQGVTHPLPPHKGASLPPKGPPPPRDPNHL